MGEFRSQHLFVAMATLTWLAGCGQLLGLDEDRSRITPDGETDSCDCDDGDPCTVDRCPDGACVHTGVADGVAPEQLEGDCRRLVCRAGEAITEADDDDLPSAEQCLSHTCVDGAVVSVPATRGDACGSSFCDGAGSCVECLDDSHCRGADRCGGAGEVGVCGCAPLSCAELGMSCGTVSNGCDGTLVCDNGLRDGLETDVDCGGLVSACGQRCEEGRVCHDGNDCTTAFCGGGACAVGWGDALGSAKLTTAVASNAAGGVAVVGDFVSSTVFAPGVTLSTPTRAGYVALFDAKGAVVEAVALQDGTSVRDVGVDGAGNIVVVGTLGNGPHIEKRDATGKPLWTLPLVTTGSATASAVAFASDGNAFVVGELDGALAIGNTVLSGYGDLFFVELDTSGGLVSSAVIASTGAQRAIDVAAGPLGQVAIAGDFSGSVELGGSDVMSAGDWDAYLAVLDPNRAVKASAIFTGSNAQQLAGITYVDSQLIAAGTFRGAMQVVSEAGNTVALSNGGADAFVMRFDASLGGIWFNRYGDGQDQRAVGLARDGRDGVVVAGHFNGSIGLGGAPLVSAGGSDVFVAVLDADGGTRRSRRFGDAQAQYASAVGTSVFGSVFVTGSFRGTVDFGHGPVTSTGNGEEAFLAAF